MSIQIRSYVDVSNNGIVDDEPEFLRQFHNSSHAEYDMLEDLQDCGEEAGEVLGLILGFSPTILSFDEEEGRLVAMVEISLNDELEPGHLQFLLHFVLGHWNDGFGGSFSENFLQATGFSLELIPGRYFLDFHALIQADEKRRVLIQL